MTTAEHLERMTNRGEFEILANAVLSKANSDDYAPLIALGINAQGETIPAPTDGFCKVPDSDPPRFVWFQHTTRDRSKLREKWLSESEKEPGDLIKAAQRATQMKTKLPDAKFTVVLSTNQRLPDRLPEEAEVKAHRLGVGIDIWEQSRYMRFLDTEPVGHYLRRHYLDIDAEMLSADLLAELGRKSLAEYAREEFQFLSPDLWVSRQLDAQLTRSVEDPTCTLVLLLGEAGFGKSAAAYRFVDKHMAVGGYGLRVPESIAQDSLNLDDMLCQTLRRLCCSLAPEEAIRIPKIIPPGDRFVVVVDDVNRTSSQATLIRKLAGWAREPYVIVCPLWPRFRAQLMNLERRQDIHIVPVERMRPDEASSAVQAVAGEAGVTVSAMEAESIASSLGHDPFLISILGQLVADAAADQRLGELVEDVLGQCVQRRISEAVDASVSQRFHQEFKDALLAVTSCMLKHREVRPSWTKVESWLQQTPKHLEALRDLCHHGRLCHISSEVEFRFLHDRFLQYFCVESIRHFLDDVDATADVLSEPHYAELIAQALLRAPRDEDLLNTVRDRNPLALVSTVRYMGAPSSEYHRLIVKKVKEWMRAYAGRYSSRTPESLRWAVAICFLSTDSPAVLDIVNTDFGLRYKTWLGDFARFRNGDPSGALKYCSIFGLRREQDGYLFNQLVEHAALHHRDRLVRDLKDVLRSAQERPDIDGAPILAGFLGFTELHDAVAEWWSGVSDRPKYLVEALWATLRCSENPHEDELLDSMISYWAELPDVIEEQRTSKRESVGAWLCAALPTCVDDNLLRYLIEQAKQEVLRVPIARICCQVDQPDAIEFALRVSAEMPDRERPCSAWSWPSAFGTKLSRASVARLHDLWTESHDSDSLRTIAFRLWLRNVDRERVDVVETVRTLAPGDALFKDALWERARLGDKGCVASLVAVLESDISLFRVAHPVWSAEVAAVAERHLKAFQNDIPTDFSGGRENRHYDLAYLLMSIPRTDAESLLAKYWTHLRYGPLFIQSTLYVGTPRCLELADEAIAECPSEADVFRHLLLRFDLTPTAIGDVSTLERIKTLGRYWRHFDDTTLRRFADACYKFGDEGSAWCREHLPESINEACRMRYCPTDDDLMEMLDQRVGFSETSIALWMDELRKHTDPRKLMGVLRRWLESKPTSQKVQVAAMCIERIGQREHLDMLDHAMERIKHRWLVEAQVESVKFDVRRRTLQ